MSKEEEETTYSNDSHMDLLCENEEECAMVAQDSPSSEDLDDSIVTFGQKTQRKKILRKYIMKVSSNMTVVLKKNCHAAIQEKQQVSLHILQNTQVKRVFVKNRIWHEGDDAKTVFWGEPSEKYQSKILIKKESGEEEYFGSTDEPQEPNVDNVDSSRNLFIDQDMVCETSNKYDEASETSRGDIEKEKFRKFLYDRAVHVLNVYRIKLVLQAEMLSVIEGYKELVNQDTSLMPLESSRFREDDEIVEIT